MKFWFNYINKILNIAELRIKLFILLLLSLVSSLLDVLSISLLIPITNLLLSENYSAFSNFKLISTLYNSFRTEHLLILFGILFFLKALSTIAIYKYVTKIKLDLQVTLRVKLLKGYQNSEYQSFLQRHFFLQFSVAVLDVLSLLLCEFLFSRLFLLSQHIFLDLN